MTSRELARATRRFADQQSTRFANVPTTKAILADVMSVSPVVTVDWRGGEVPVAKVLPGYTPVVGDRVACLVIDDQLVVLG